MLPCKRPTQRRTGPQPSARPYCTVYLEVFIEIFPSLTCWSHLWGLRRSLLLWHYFCGSGMLLTSRFAPLLKCSHEVSFLSVQFLRSFYPLQLFFVADFIASVLKIVWVYQLFLPVDMAVGCTGRLLLARRRVLAFLLEASLVSIPHGPSRASRECR